MHLRDRVCSLKQYIMYVIIFLNDPEFKNRSLLRIKGAKLAVHDHSVVGP